MVYTVTTDVIDIGDPSNDRGESASRSVVAVKVEVNRWGEQTAKTPSRSRQVFASPCSDTNCGIRIPISTGFLRRPVQPC